MVILLAIRVILWGMCECVCGGGGSGGVYKVKVKNLFSINPRQRIMTEENMTNIELSLQILEI